MKKALISQPMFGKTHEEIREVREKATEWLNARGNEAIGTYNKISRWWRNRS